MRITEDMYVCNVLGMDSLLEEIFLSHDLNCVGCPGGETETIQEAAAGHEVNLEQLLSDLNKVLNR